MSRFINKRFFSLSFLLLAFSSSAQAFDVWQYPQSADKGSIFAGVFAATFSFDFSDPVNSEFVFDYPDFYVDCVLPIGLPFSLGLSFDSFRVDQYGLGLRPAYHINLDAPNVDVYAMYSLDLDISKSSMILDHGLRLGLRYIFYDLFCFNVETGYRFQSVNFGISLKLH